LLHDYRGLAYKLAQTHSQHPAGFIARFKVHVQANTSNSSYYYDIVVGNIGDRGSYLTLMISQIFKITNLNLVL
jgi:hypothetical protein